MINKAVDFKKESRKKMEINTVKNIRIKSIRLIWVEYRSKM